MIRVPAFVVNTIDFDRSSKKKNAACKNATPAYAVQQTSSSVQQAKYTPAQAAPVAQSAVQGAMQSPAQATQAAPAQATGKGKYFGPSTISAL